MVFTKYYAVMLSRLCHLTCEPIRSMAPVKWNQWQETLEYCIWVWELEQADMMEAHLEKDMTLSSMSNYT